jgi:hypothetical protein
MKLNKAFMNWFGYHHEELKGKAFITDLMPSVFA